MRLRTADRIAEVSASARSGPDGFEATRHFVVDQVDGFSAEQKNGASLFAPGLPQYAWPHPFLPGIAAHTVTSIPFDTDSFFITVQYKRLPKEEEEPDEVSPTQIEVGSRTEFEETNKDADGNRIVVKFIKRNAAGVQIDAEKADNGTVSVLAIKTFLRFTRRETEPPSDKSEEFSKKINSTPFQGLPKGVALCLGITGASEDSGETYVVHYDFAINREGWGVDVVYIDPEIGKYPGTEQDVKNKNGILEDIVVYKSIDFNRLKL